ncbi:aminoglycoside phosphotransferase family protein [Shimia sagamensis]|uniref:Predicted kinase, aminoglycoside phosphotransferase (APT) family n=1 Tax=Shimia sagamensis TaxID=1566352 RepID=A0ABY1N6G0_9RHOB|nr:aminoglycoside phosphotransferase family protein [Shimia sagamensis]SMP01144.1 Predicted kinase, aminoglycoside phosphotransferase (APT) family [Shimia sagamensis]
MTQPPIHLWDLCCPLEPLSGGHRNQVWRTRGLPRDLVFKSTTRGEAALNWLAPVQAVARRCGFVVPQMMRSANGWLSETGWTCETFVEGEFVPREALAEVAALLFNFHAQTQDWQQRPGFLSSTVLLSQECGGDVDLTQMPPDVVALCRAAWQALPDTPTCVVHGDLAPGNVLQLSDGRFAFLDWDECRVDLPLFDTAPHAPKSRAETRAHLAWEVACSWAREPSYARDMAERLRNA